MLSSPEEIARRIILVESVAIVVLAAIAGWQTANINEQTLTIRVLWTLGAGLGGYAAVRLIIHFTINRQSAS